MGLIKPNDLLRELVADLEPKYGHEAHSMAMILIEDVLHLVINDVLLNSPVEYAASHQQSFAGYIDQLKNDIPIQQAVGWADFYGYRFKVSKDVLIPRQETEELVHLVTEIIQAKNYSSVLDIGTGSGCIAVSLALENKNVAVSAVDVSAEALAIARANSKNLGAKINFLHHDILNDSPDTIFDVIVSNPPYVTESEKPELPANVLNHDPDLALFVSDQDPLLFYRRITEVADELLSNGGLLAFEINERYGSETVILLQNHGFNDVIVKKDLNNKPRIVLGYKK